MHMLISYPLLIFWSDVAFLWVSRDPQMALSYHPVISFDWTWPSCASEPPCFWGWYSLCLNPLFKNYYVRTSEDIQSSRSINLTLSEHQFNGKTLRSYYAALLLVSTLGSLKQYIPLGLGGQWLRHFHSWTPILWMLPHLPHTVWWHCGCLQWGQFPGARDRHPAL